MSDAIATVYDPPSPGFPYLAVILRNDRVIFARPVASVEDGDALLAAVLPAISHRIDEDEYGDYAGRYRAGERIIPGAA